MIFGMPAKNAVKVYSPNTYYHIYNRGVNKQLIFEVPEDYELFISLIDRYMSPIPHKNDKREEYPNFWNNLEILAYCLMPNHYHLLIKTNNRGDVMAEFMQCLITSFTIHQNKRNNRVGHLFQGRYRAVTQANQAQFLHISRYIHQNPAKMMSVDRYMYSSYRHYLRPGKEKPVWLNADGILRYFSHYDSDGRAEYQVFMTEYSKNI